MREPSTSRQRDSDERIRYVCAFIFIPTDRLTEGKLAAERDRAADLGSFIENT
jgi:hypothetical protein